jgi:hypothetical protein
VHLVRLTSWVDVNPTSLRRLGCNFANPAIRRQLQMSPPHDRLDRHEYGGFKDAEDGLPQACREEWPSTSLLFFSDDCHLSSSTDNCKRTTRKRGIVEFCFEVTTLCTHYHGHLQVQSSSNRL